MRKTLTALLFCVAPALFAADVRVTQFSIDRTTMQTSERFTAQFRWRNFGPDVARDIVAELGANSGVFVVTGAGTSGWPCEPSHGASSFVCRGAQLAPGEEAHMVVTMRTPARGSSFTLPVSLRTSSHDPDLSNNAQQIAIALTPWDTAVDMTISPREQTHRAAGGANVTIPVTVTNAGPANARNVIASIWFAEGVFVPMEASGAGWNCQHPTHSPWAMLCMRSSLDAGASAPITITTAAPTATGNYTLSARISAEDTYDAHAANDIATATITVGTPVTEPPPGPSYKRILVPLTPAEVPGINGARWKTDTTLLTNGVTIEPQLGNARGGQFIYVLEEDEARVQLNARVWDVARQLETAGSEIPIVREREFKTTTAAIVGIPVAPQYRQMLRIYDFDGRAGARVAIHFIGVNGRTESISRTLGVVSDAKATPAQLPVHPGYVEVDLGSVFPLTGIEAYSLRIEPLDPNLKLWSFVSVTNNETHHVTTFSQQ